ncbi:MAG: DUF523 domain-containing protein [Proteobacteria bacterium]|nr:DUF523 domain-containing protein [Pseudomonadota bacterium]
MIKVMISACLLGEKVRYDGRDNALDSEVLKSWLRENRLVSICPEVVGGLPVPRPPAEISGGDGSAVLSGMSQVLTLEGKDVSDSYVSGARQALKLARENQVRLAIMKARSPSCGKLEIYDGSFANRLKTGRGVTAALLEREGIRVFNEDQLAEAQQYASALEDADR